MRENDRSRCSTDIYKPNKYSTVLASIDVNVVIQIF